MLDILIYHLSVHFFIQCFIYLYQPGKIFPASGSGKNPSVYCVLHSVEILSAKLSIFTSAIPCYTFSNGKQGREALRLLVRTASLLTRLLFPAHTFSSVAAGLITQFEKVLTIMTKIRKGYSRPLISRKIRSFATLADAGRFIDRLTEANRNDYAFNIIQQDGRWLVCSVIAGGAQ